MQYLSRTSPSKLDGKIVLVRTDFNVEDVKDSLRLSASLSTLTFLKKSKAITLIVSHRGRPKATATKKPHVASTESLRVVAPFLKKHLKAPITFLSTFDFADIQKKLKKAAPGSIFLLENIRLVPGEETNDVKLGKSLASLADIYVNDAFAVSHRANASVTQVPKLLPSYCGFLLQKELEILGGLSKNPARPFVVILGGAKASDKIGVLQRFLPHTSAILLGGAPANTFLKARGFDIGGSVYEEHMLSVVKPLLKNRHIMLPVDFISDKGKLLDIGPETIAMFASHLKHAKTILWNGPMGLFENARFAKGSRTLAKLIAKSGAHSVVGGGETTTLVRSLKLEKKFSFLSTGGGAMLDLLAGEKLPGIEALD